MAMEIVFEPSSMNRQERVVQITVIDDMFVENDENLTSVVSISSDDDAVVLNPGQASINILNDDSKFFSIQM